MIVPPPLRLKVRMSLWPFFEGTHFSISGCQSPMPQKSPIAAQTLAGGAAISAERDTLSASAGVAAMAATLATAAATKAVTEIGVLRIFAFPPGHDLHAGRQDRSGLVPRVSA